MIIKISTTKTSWRLWRVAVTRNQDYSKLKHCKKTNPDYKRSTLPVIEDEIIGYNETMARYKYEATVLFENYYEMLSWCEENLECGRFKGIDSARYDVFNPHSVIMFADEISAMAFRLRWE